MEPAWNVNIQRELPWQMSLEVAYVGHARVAAFAERRRRTESESTRPAISLARLRAEPAGAQSVLRAGHAAASSRRRRSAGAQLLRPYPQFTDIIPLYSSGASSNYHALQVSFSKRLSRGLLIDGNYTWAKNIEEGLTHQDSYNIRGDRALASDRHRAPLCHQLSV